MIIDRFLKYVSFDTTSDPNSGKHPSTDKQFDLLDELEKDMKEIGLTNIKKDDECYIYGILKANDNRKKSVGFISHIDTSCDACGKNIRPNIINNYDGSDILLNPNLKMKVEEFPILSSFKGRTLITTDGTTLLGGDDKAGVAEILEAVDYINKKGIPHGDIYVGFTPDEEIGEGTLFFDLAYFKPDYCYTVDGGIEGEITYENFNAASALVTINGFNIHPGHAKGHMKNSITIANEFDSLLPKFKRPEYTENYEGFNHLNNIEGNVEKTKMHYIIRNHDKTLFENQKQEFINARNIINNKYGENTCVIEIKDSYYNMYDILKNKKDVIELAISSIKEAGLTPSITPIRGGTDGATLTYKGLPCPNLGTSDFNCHGKYEFVTVEGMNKVIEIIINIVKRA